MKLSYVVTEENLLEMIESSLRERYHKPVSLAITLLLSLGLLALSIALCLNGLLGGAWRALLIVLSVGICLLNYFSRINVSYRARLAQRSYQKQGSGNEDFWKPHRLEIGEGTIRLRYGKEDRQYADCLGLEAKTLPHTIILHLGSELLDVIPRGVFDSSEMEQAFLNQIHRTAYAAIAASIEDKKAGLPDTFRYHVHYSYDKPTYLNHQRRAQRHLLTIREGWPAKASLRFGIALLCLYYVLTRQITATWLVAVCVLAFILLNMPLFISFTPLLNRRVEKALEPLLSYVTSGEAEMYVTERSVFITGELYFQELPISQISAMKNWGDMLAMYQKQGSFLTVRRPDGAEAAEFGRFAEYLAYRISQHQEPRRGWSKEGKS